MPASQQTTEKVEGPWVKQFSVFLQNKVGALMEVVKLLHENAVHVLALNVQDSADSAIVRIVTSDPEHVAEVFEIHDIAYSVTEFVVVELKGGASQLPALLAALLAAEVNIHGCYSLLSRPRGNSALGVHVEDNECAAAVLRGHGFRILSQNDISR